METKKLRCRVHIYKKDCLRRTGRGKSGFEMHYTEQQCSRKASKDNRCKQHQDESFKIYPDDWFREFWESENR
ncbi:MAG: hypothetical protein KJ578_15735 [Bacteroidetes bacterium]|nr:hypothetical protein [Bacteroidota bacterium]